MVPHSVSRSLPSLFFSLNFRLLYTWSASWSAKVWMPTQLIIVLPQGYLRRLRIARAPCGLLMFKFCPQVGSNVDLFFSVVFFSFPGFADVKVRIEETCFPSSSAASSSRKSRRLWYSPLLRHFLCVEASACGGNGILPFSS